MRLTAPVFVVGMPRSGTTLTEQILASHPKVTGVGELVEVDEALARAAKAERRETDGYFKNISELTREVVQNEAGSYLSVLKKHSRRGWSTRCPIIFRPWG